ncbi:aminopeptidase P family protein [bacterium]|nr:aminopeptidase P family protein [bacterium]
MNIYEKRTRIVQEKMSRLGLPCILITRPEHIFYLSGYCASPVGAQPVILIIPQNRDPIMIVAEHEEGGAKEKTWIENIKTYAYYTILKKPGITQQIAELILAALKELEVARGSLGIEETHISFAFTEAIRNEFPLVNFKNFSHVLEEMRIVKSKDEIEAIKKAVGFCDLCQKIARESLTEGMSEIELFTKIKSALEIKAGERISVEGDLVFGEGTEGGGDLPGKRKLQKNDFVMTDLCVRINGYWGDTTRTIVFGDASKKQKKIYQVVLEALNIGIEAIRPGIKASEIDKRVRDFIISKGYGEYFGHHTGHGIGLTHFEAPMIVPYNETELKEGMVITIEPGIYIPNQGGIRLEEDIVVTEAGRKIISKHSLGFEGEHKKVRKLQRKDNLNLRFTDRGGDE